MTLEDLAELMVREFARIDERFDHLEERIGRLEERIDRLEERIAGLEKGVAALEESNEDHTGRFISLEDQVAKIHYIIQEADLLNIKKRVQRLEEHTFSEL